MVMSRGNNDEQLGGRIGNIWATIVAYTLSGKSSLHTRNPSVNHSIAYVHHQQLGIAVVLPEAVICDMALGSVVVGMEMGVSIIIPTEFFNTVTVRHRNRRWHHSWAASTTRGTTFPTARSTWNVLDFIGTFFPTLRLMSVLSKSICLKVNESHIGVRAGELAVKTVPFEQCLSIDVLLSTARSEYCVTECLTEF